MHRAQEKHSEVEPEVQRKLPRIKAKSVADVEPEAQRKSAIQHQSQVRVHIICLLLVFSFVIEVFYCNFWCAYTTYQMKDMGCIKQLILYVLIHITEETKQA
jgi:hypothetical protein